MRHTTKITLLLLLLSAALAPDAAAQKYPERSLVRKGNKLFNQGEFNESEIRFRSALEKAPESREAMFNLGDAIYKQGGYEEAKKIFETLAQDSTASNRPDVLYNLGNTYCKQEKWDEAIEAYKEALRRNPSDMDAKYNLAYAKKMKQENEDENGSGGDDQQNQDGQKDQDEDQNGQDDKNNDGKQDQNNDQQQQPQPQGGMSEQEAERMLEAIQMSEDKTREKMEERQAVEVAPSGKNW